MLRSLSGQKRPFVQRLSAWNAVYDLHVPDIPLSEVFHLSAEAKAAFEKATAEVVQAVRTELAPGDILSVEELAGALFSKPGR